MGRKIPIKIGSAILRQIRTGTARRRFQRLAKCSAMSVMVWGASAVANLSRQVPTRPIDNKANSTTLTPPQTVGNTGTTSLVDRVMGGIT